MINVEDFVDNTVNVLVSEVKTGDDHNLYILSDLVSRLLLY